MTIKPQEETLPKSQIDTLVGDLRQIIDQTKISIASTVNVGLTLLYWHVGSRIRSEILQDERAEYGKRIVATVSRQLASEYGKGFLEKSLHRMVQFSETFPDQQIVRNLAKQLS